jgi:hypothetical protein
VNSVVLSWVLRSIVIMSPNGVVGVDGDDSSWD